MADVPEPTAFDLAVMASPVYQRAKRAADEFTADMERLVTQTGESPENLELLQAAVQRIAEGRASEPHVGAPYTHTFAPARCESCEAAGDPECRDGLLYRDGGPELDYVGRCAHSCHQVKPSFTITEVQQ